MRMHRRWFAISIGLSLIALIGFGLRGGQVDDAKQVTVDEVTELWKPMLTSVRDFQRFGGSPKESPTVAAHTFRAVGPSFEDVWNYYAKKCGSNDRYEAKRLLATSGTTAQGSFVITDRLSADPKAEHVLSIFLLRTARYTVTVTIQPDTNGKAVYGSIAAVIP